jgi:hypothetical protein
VATFNGSELANQELAECMRKSAAYFEEYGYGHVYQKLMDCADELDPPALKCSHQTCDEYAMFRLSADETDMLPGRIAYRCGLHIASWVVTAVLYGTVKVDLL